MAKKRSKRPGNAKGMRRMRDPDTSRAVKSITSGSFKIDLQRKLSTDTNDNQKIGVTITELDNGDYRVDGISDKDKMLLGQAFSEKYGTGKRSGILPRKAVTLLDADGKPTTDRDKVCDIEVENGSMVPVAWYNAEQVEPGKGAVKTYLYCLDRLLEGARRDPDSIRNMYGVENPEAGVQWARTLWAKMRNARIFEIPISTYTAFYETAEDTVHQKLGYVLNSHKITEGNVDLLGRDLPFPDPLPFNHTYLGIGAGVPLPEALSRMRVKKAHNQARLEGVTLLGYLLVDGLEPTCTEMCHVEYDNGDGFLLPCTYYIHGSWDGGHTLTPWIVNNMIELLNSHRVVIEKPKHSLDIKTAFKKQSREMRETVAPPPYYTIRMADKYIEAPSGVVVGEKSPGGRAGVKLTYRHDREGHDRVYVRRGPLPLSADDRTKLASRDYTVTTGMLSAEDAEKLSARRKPPKRIDEWVALHTVRIPQKIIGDDSLPYVPGVRIPKTSKASALAAAKQTPSIL